MSLIRVLSTPTNLPFNPMNRRGLPSGFGGKSRCSAGRFVTGGVGGDRLIGSSWVGSISPFGLNEAFLRKEKGSARGERVVCAAALLNPQNLHWISAISTVILMFAKGTPIVKSFLPIYFVLQAPACAVSWLKSEYGNWTALLALLVRLFYPLPEELELPFMAMLLSITSPTQTLNLRGTPAAAIISVVLAAYLAYQHFSKMGSVQNAFDAVSIFSTLALICVVAVPLILLFIY